MTPSIPSPELEAISPEHQAAQEKLANVLQGCDRLLVAYSGGVDSALLLDFALEVMGRERVLGVLARSETLTDREYDEAKALAVARDWPLREIEYSELEIENYADNPTNRCYFCKKEMFGRLTDLCASWEFTHIADGTNADDVGDHRPGMAAARELKICSPLMDAGWTKSMIRSEARRRGMTNWSKPSGACLSSRFPYGTRITRNGLDQVASGEEFLIRMGVETCRVRHGGETCRIEVLPEDMPKLFVPETREKLLEHFRSIGFTYVTLDLKGYRTGSLNEILSSIEKAE